MKEYNIYTSDGVFWGTNTGTSFQNACDTYFGVKDDAIWQVLEGDYDSKNLTLYGFKLLQTKPI